jgi:hypothetical protein
MEGSGMSERGQHSHWLSLLDVSGPFLAEPVLKDAFPQGLEGLDPEKKRLLRQAYDEWREAIDLDDTDLPKIHRAWIALVLKQGLELDDTGSSEVLKSSGDLPKGLECELPEHGVTLRPDFAVVDREGRGLMLVAVYAPDLPLREVMKGAGSTSAPSDRMVELCRGVGVRLGLVTNGEQWMLVDAPNGGATTFASWFARLWSSEPITLQAFTSLLGIRRFFVDQSGKLPALLDKSLEHQDEVTDALGEQVRRAVEVLIQALDRADVDRNRELLKGIDPTELYEAGLTVMMRIVFLLSAEERGLLLMGDERYEANYAVSTLRMQLRSEPEEVLERRWDAWSRLLSVFRVVFGGIEHEALRLPALGGSLFDPDRFPFLEGRAKGSRWKSDPATPLPIDNRTVLLLLNAVQLFQGRTLSYASLDVEQIGYAYEGLLERTVSRAKEVTLDLNGTRSAKHPWVSLSELDHAEVEGRTAVEELLRERTASSASRVRNDLDRDVDEVAAEKLLTACHGKENLRDRIKPYFHLLRVDPWGYPLVYPKGTFMVAAGSDRRETGTHYTPKSLTQTIVEEALEPAVYVGYTEGLPRKQWKLKSAAALLDLKICDPAMGSGAFLVQVCRWLAERLMDAWKEAEEKEQSSGVESIAPCEPPLLDPEERKIAARRLIAERCLYGVDSNPLAVELAKLSIWLVTISKGRPFGFLDHNFRCGDSLLGITSIDQLKFLDMFPSKSKSKHLFTGGLDEALDRAIELRRDLRARPIRDIRDIEVMARLDAVARQAIELPARIADALIGHYFASDGEIPDLTSFSIDVGNMLAGKSAQDPAVQLKSASSMNNDAPPGRSARRPFHWPLEFPEVFGHDRHGFDAIVGNPPFMGGTLATEKFGNTYTSFLQFVGSPWHGKADYVVGFFKLAAKLLQQKGAFCFLATSSFLRGETLESGLRHLLAQGWQIYSARSPFKWPGKATLEVIHLGLTRNWSGPSNLDGKVVDGIDEELKPRIPDGRSPLPLASKNLFGALGIKLCPANREISPDRYSEAVLATPALKQFFVPALGGEEIYDLVDLQRAPRAIDPALLQNYLSKAKAVPNTSMIRVELPSNYKHARAAATLMQKIAPSSLVFACGETSTDLRFRRVPRKGYILKHKLVVFPTNNWATFAILQSEIHVQWAWRWGLRRETRIVYSPKRCAATFPLPDMLTDQYCISSELEAIATEYHELRTDLMTARDEGLTKLYNRLHRPEELSADIDRFRSAQRELDESVLRSYGWDIDLEHGFYETDHGLRFTIAPAARQQVLDALMELNHRRAGEGGLRLSGISTDNPMVFN